MCLACVLTSPISFVARCNKGNRRRLHKAYCGLCEYGEFKLDKLQIDILFKAQKPKLTPHLKKLCHKFIQNFHQIEWTKKIAAQKVKGRKKTTQQIEKEARMDKLKIATDCNLVFKNLLA